ncbi:site-specific DNA-methyltransferase [Agrobacterium tumefaciens]|uniref:Methyltransferase n=1 Tax=Agrobacterium tumefaciens TaxID=358 RepID=A0AAJ4MZZ6_AGRTU|nr:site-specific DNA-methyltransferase [Agrobacterium tumefaciens]
MTITLHPGDNRLTLRRLIDEGVRVHSVVTDPPYGLVSIQKRFGKKDSKAARTEKNDGSFARLSGGFMGKMWDGTGIERDPEFWKLIYDILLPGGYVFAFSGSRTGHWQACAMELAGFIMHPMHGWCFGSGFPKPTNLKNVEGYEGWGYGTQTQKPALEPIYLGQKPFSEKTGPLNVLKHGVGAVNIDGCRVPAPGEDISNHSRSAESAISKGKYGDSKAQETHQTAGQALGRHPANLILDGSPEVVAMFPAKAGAAAPVKGTEPSSVTKDIYGKFNGRTPGTFFNDEGSAARFFHQFGPDADPLIYHGKAGKIDRAGGNHPTVKPIALMQYLIRHITPPDGTVLDPFAGSGTTGEAAKREGMNCILMEAEPEYIEFLEKRFDIAKPEFDFDDILGEAMPKQSTKSGVQFDDILGS